MLTSPSRVFADLHSSAVCVDNRSESPVGGTAWSVSYSWVKNYEILPDATKCACDYYKNRNTGDNQWDQCPDCTFVGRHLGNMDEYRLTCVCDLGRPRLQLCCLAHWW